MKQILYTKKLFQLLFIDITNLNLCIASVVKCKMKEKCRQENGEDTGIASAYVNYQVTGWTNWGSDQNVLTSSGAYHMEWVSGNSVPEGKSGRA